MVISTPVPPVKCALVSDAEGPVYVNVPDDALYVNEPSPPLSNALTAFLASLSARAVV